MTPRSCAATVSLLGALLGCAASKEETGSLASISPNVAYNNIPLDVDIDVAADGSPFRPAYSFDTMEGTTAAEAGSYAVTLRSISGGGGGGGANDATPVAVAMEAVAWTSATKLKATVPAGVPAGAYDVVVTDPRGQTAVLPQAFTSLGPDETAPVITINSPEPGGIIGALTTITVKALADDGHGLVQSMRLVVSVSTEPDRTKECSGTPAPLKTCELQFLPPIPADETAVVKVVATAIDSFGNEATAEPTAYRLVPRPAVRSMTPTVGPTGGGTEIVLKGTDFVVPVDPSRGSDLLIDGKSIAIATITPTEIRGVTDRHDPGIATVQVSNGAARSAPRLFEFVAPPSVRMVNPPRGPVAGGTWIAVVGNHFRDGVTEISVGGMPLGEPCYVSANRMEGRVPAGDAVGAVDVSAYDLIGGTGATEIFTYEAGEPTTSDPPDGGPEPFLCPGAP